MVVFSLQVTGRQFLASEAWSTSEELLQELAITKVVNGVLGVAIQSSTIPGFEHFLRGLNPIHRPDDEFLRDLWEMEFRCSPVRQIWHSHLIMFLFLISLTVKNVSFISFKEFLLEGFSASLQRCRDPG